MCFLSYGGPYRVVGRQGGVDASHQSWFAVHQRWASSLVEPTSGDGASCNPGSDARSGGRIGHLLHCTVHVVRTLAETVQHSSLLQ